VHGQRGQALRIEDLRTGLGAVRALALRDFADGSPAALGALVSVDEGGHERRFFLAPHGGGSALAGGAVHLVDVAVAGARQGDRAEASLASSTRFIEVDAAVWSNNTVRVASRNLSGAAFDLGAATLSVAVTKRRIP